MGTASKKLTVVDLRKCWRPRHEELKEQCASCPFGEGNDDEFGLVVAKLRKAAGLPRRKVTPAMIAFAREQVRRDVARTGEFACHCTAYDQATMLPAKDRDLRQCAGAAAFYRSGALP